MDMLGLALKGMGFDPSAIIEQARQIGTAFGQLNENDLRLFEQLQRIEANQLSIMTHLGLYVPPPSAEVAEMIAIESRKHIDAHGGPADPPIEEAAVTSQDVHSHDRRVSA